MWQLGGIEPQSRMHSVDHPTLKQTICSGGLGPRGWRVTQCKFPLLTNAVMWTPGSSYTWITACKVCGALLLLGLKASVVGMWNVLCLPFLCSGESILAPSWSWLSTLLFFLCCYLKSLCLWVSLSLCSLPVCSCRHYLTCGYLFVVLVFLCGGVKCWVSLVSLLIYNPVTSWSFDIIFLSSLPYINETLLVKHGRIVLTLRIAFELWSHPSILLLVSKGLLRLYFCFNKTTSSWWRTGGKKENKRTLNYFPCLWAEKK